MLHFVWLYLSFFLQLAFYDQFKIILMATPFFNDDIITHFSASFMAVSKHALLSSNKT